MKGKIWVYRYPDFYRPELKRVAVLPFADRTRSHGVGERISDKVSAILTNNGTYEVYTRAHLKDILAERDLADAGIIDADVAMEIGRLKSVQALVCGVCDRYETTTRNETRYKPVAVWGKNAQGQRVITGWKKEPYQWTQHDAFVECQAVVIDTATGQQLTAVRDPSSDKTSGSPPKQTTADILRSAEEDQVNRIVQAIAVVRTPIKLKGTVLKTATDLYDQEWDWQKQILPEDGHFFVVVKLPPEADRNNFKITIVPKDERQILAEHSFVWAKGQECRGYRFDAKPIVDQHGFGKYQAKLYSGPEPVARYDFSIVEMR
ncbi:MAG: hypothetical protein JXQ75_20350 [Phycisphaerae bacterium]|nr:hypothetical protein [Phycisphaerae bacterium]